MSSLRESWRTKSRFDKGWLVIVCVWAAVWGWYGGSNDTEWWPNLAVGFLVFLLVFFILGATYKRFAPQSWRSDPLG